MDAGIRRNWAKALWLSGELDEAVGVYEAAIEVCRNQAAGLKQAGRLHHNLLAELHRDLISLHLARLDTRSAVLTRRALVDAFPLDLAARSELLVSLHYLPEIASRERRLPVLAGKPAKRMASYINYPNTLGISSWDYRLTDSICDPPGIADELNLEKLVRLDPCAWAYDPAFGLTGDLPDPGPSPMIANGHVTFGVLCRPTKIIPEAVGLWAAAIASTPNARLAVLQGQGISREWLLKVLTREGIAVDRIELLPTGDRSHYLSLHRRIDILLDTRPYNGMTGTCDALWMGVPVITLQGQSHVSRVGGSLLRTVGLDDCVADSAEGYAQTAAGLAAAPKLLTRLRQGLRRRFAASPLADGTRIALRVEGI